MTQTANAEALKEASRPRHVTALEHTLKNYRNALFADLARANTNERRAEVRDQMRDLARLIRNGLMPLAVWLNAEGHSSETQHRLKHLLDELDQFAHPSAGIPAHEFNAACASCPLIHELPRKLDLLAAGIGRLSIRQTGGAS